MGIPISNYLSIHNPKIVITGLKQKTGMRFFEILGHFVDIYMGTSQKLAAKGGTWFFWTLTENHILAISDMKKFAIPKILFFCESVLT